MLPPACLTPVSWLNSFFQENKNWRKSSFLVTLSTYVSSKLINPTSNSNVTLVSLWFSSAYNPLTRTLVTTLVHLDNLGWSQNPYLHLQNFFCVIRWYTWLPEIRLWTYLGDHYSAHRKYFEPKEFMKYTQVFCFWVVLFILLPFISPVLRPFLDLDYTKSKVDNLAKSGHSYWCFPM